MSAAHRMNNNKSKLQNDPKNLKNESKRAFQYDGKTVSIEISAQNI